MPSAAKVTTPPAPDFSLSDQFGTTDALFSFKGWPVALTFLYTNCPDVPADRFQSPPELQATGWSWLPVPIS